MADNAAARQPAAADRLARPIAAGQPAGKHRSRLVSAIFVPAILALLGIAILSGLGIWQLERKAWKEGLLAAIAERASAPAGEFPPESGWAALSPDKDEYRHARLTGRFLNDKEAHLQANLVSPGRDDGALGYDILTPLRLADGALVIVNRGFVPLAKKEASTRPDGQIEGEVSVEGLIRFPQPHSWFIPADDTAKNVWFSRDPAPIASAYGLQRVAPVIVDADAGPDKAALPRGGQTRIAFANDHLQYALTWFGLAIVLAGVFLASALSRRRSETRTT
ncbi:surfeit locus 1 family protein [Rhizobiales bacterium GAS188]|nr:surfeit locus 1 family protein [Rhizobiales bacterium GAS188]